MSEIVKRGVGPQIGSLGIFLRVAAKLRGRGIAGVAGVARNVEELCIKIHHSNITCSPRFRQTSYDSVDIQLFRRQVPPSSSFGVAEKNL